MEIELKEIIHNGKKIQVAGEYPRCKDSVVYIGIGPVMDGYIKGTGFKSHKGKCLGCNTEYSISPGK